MWRKLSVGFAALTQQQLCWRHSTATATAVNSMLLRSLKEHYLEVSKMTPPPKVNPPSPFTVVKGALDGTGPVLRRSYGDEEISIAVMRLANIIPDADADADDINQLFIHVDVSKPSEKESLLFLCALYPDALGIHSVSMRRMAEPSALRSSALRYNGPRFEYYAYAIAWNGSATCHNV
uniref:uncharacterized protein LOC101292157 isoform X2 n=1 Tax=Fragaria vesca subsp. vesca TaxID=101020 RepID=UPI0005C8369C|nr:PREDICTED: uncharacterized protein LOC101292157 isoform X2 [Fragaria vesca subsp. vesca]